jgi:hypothetical protein
MINLGTGSLNVSGGTVSLINMGADPGVFTLMNFNSSTGNFTLDFNSQSLGTSTATLTTTTHSLVRQCAMQACLPVLPTQAPPLARHPAIFLVEPHGPFVFPASHYVDISDYQAEKGRLLLNHRSQEEAMRLAGGSGLEEMSRRLDGYRGEQVGCAYAECFVPMRARGALKPFGVLP